MSGKSGQWRGIDWATQPLGKVPDRELARSIPCSPSAVRRAREHRAIPPFDPGGAAVGQPPVLPPEPAPPGCGMRIRLARPRTEATDADTNAARGGGLWHEGLPPFMALLNVPGWLEDETGARRAWPVARVAHLISEAASGSSSAWYDSDGVLLPRRGRPPRPTFDDVVTTAYLLRDTASLPAADLARLLVVAAERIAEREPDRGIRHAPTLARLRRDLTTGELARRIERRRAHLLDPAE